MSEPITLYRGAETVTTYAPSEAKRLLLEGWQPTPVVTEITAVAPEPVEAIPFTVRKAGRPKKVT